MISGIYWGSWTVYSPAAKRWLLLYLACHINNMVFNFSTSWGKYLAQITQLANDHSRPKSDILSLPSNFSSLLSNRNLTKKRDWKSSMWNRKYLWTACSESTSSALFKWTLWVSFTFRQSNVQKWNRGQRVWPLSCCVHLMHLDSFKDIHTNIWTNVNGLWHLLGRKPEYPTSSTLFALLLKV